MDRTVRSLQFEPYTLQVVERPHRNVIQAIEPEAERLLLQGGGKVLRDQEGYLYEEYLDCPWPTLVIYWPVQTRLVYLAARGQEESYYVIFVAALLPGPAGRTTPDLRLSSLGPLVRPVRGVFYAAGRPGANLR